MNTSAAQAAGESVEQKIARLERKLAAAQKDAERWKLVEIMWGSGSVNFCCNESGEFRIDWEPAESADRIYLGESPEAAIDLAQPKPTLAESAK